MEFSPPAGRFQLRIPLGIHPVYSLVGGENNSTPLIALLHPTAECRLQLDKLNWLAEETTSLLRCV